MKISKMDRTLGCLYGTATGDALGVPSSFLTPNRIRELYGWIDTFYPPEKGHIYHDGLLAGEYTDDTEQALALTHSFLRYHKVVPEDIAKELEKWADRVKDKYASPFGPSTERALKAIREGCPIGESGKYGNTNGSAMRISPLGIIHGLRDSSIEEIVRDVYQTCLVTHNTKVAVSSGAAIAWGIAVCMKGETDIGKVVEETIKAAAAGEAYGNDIPAPSIGKRIEYAVNIGGDCDTNAAMAGAMAGAMNGVDAVPLVWRETVNKVNHIDMTPVAEDLINLAPKWQVAE